MYEAYTNSLKVCLERAFKFLVRICMSHEMHYHVCHIQIKVCLKCAFKFLVRINMSDEIHY